jgi:membrane carboxypeptidase/penicillin-binding protein
MNRHFFINPNSSRKPGKRRLFRLRYLLLVLVLYAGWHFLFSGKGSEAEGAKDALAMKQAAPVRLTTQNAVALPKKPAPLTKQDLRVIDQDLVKSRNLTIDWGLQQFVSEMGDRYKLHYGGIAVLDAHTGAVLALYGQTPDGVDCSRALDTEPAASIFKVVTATAALEHGGFTDQSMFFYTGNAHTLYKNQLTNKRNKWCADISLADAFARSNNIVFGKLGIIYLGQTPIFYTAKKLGFWRQPLREIPSDPSSTFYAKDDYNLAELACGFNTQTRMSPLHAAAMITPALNNGVMVTPRIVNSTPVEKIQVMRGDTASRLEDMMERTTKSGTVCRTFRGVSADRVLKHLDIGGKSGSIDGETPPGRRNWFVGFAQNRYTGAGITVGTCLILKDHFLIEADMLTRLIVRYYFSQLPTGAPPEPERPAPRPKPAPKAKLTAHKHKVNKAKNHRT